MIRFATDDLRPEDRFDYWREMRGKALFGVTIELAPERRRAFAGAFTARPVDTAVASEMRASAYTVSRTDTDIAHVTGDSLCVGLQIRGSGTIDAGADRVSRISPGDMTINYSDLPYAALPGDHDQFHYRVLKIPFDDERMLGRPVHDLFAVRYIDDPVFSRPFRALFDALGTPHGELEDPAGDITHVARLAMVARGRLSPGMPEARAALRSGLRYAAKAIMGRRKHQQALTPSSIALELGISVRQLHVVFEGGKHSFSRTLSLMRAEEALRLLVDKPALSVTQVAHACGFDSLATFYRLFRNTYGMAPGEAREIGSVH